MSTIARFSLDEYDRIVETAVLDQRHVEFVRGEIREMAPIGPAYEDVVDELGQWSVKSVSEKARVRIQQSVGLPGLENAPQPDDVFLIIEVAESSLRYDRGDKAALYAAAGVADYRVVNLPDRTVEVRRDPHEAGYRSVTVHRDQDEVRPLAFPDVVLRPAMLWE